MVVSHSRSKTGRCEFAALSSPPLERVRHLAVGLEDIKAALTLLAETYPSASRRAISPAPAIEGRDRSGSGRAFPRPERRERGAALQFHVISAVYLQSLVEGAARVDLDGVVVGTVTALDAEHARGRIAEIMAARDTEAAAAKAARKATAAREGRSSGPSCPRPRTAIAASPTPANSVVKLKTVPC